MSAQGALDGYAHRAVVVTDRDFTRGDVYNARYLRRARHFRDEQEVRGAIGALSGLGSRLRFNELLRGTERRGYRRIAIWNLIDEGVLIPEEPGHVLDRSWLRVAAGLKEAA